jgi:hypothetical protein
MCQPQARGRTFARRNPLRARRPPRLRCRRYAGRERAYPRSVISPRREARKIPQRRTQSRPARKSPLIRRIFGVSLQSIIECISFPRASSSPRPSRPEDRALSGNPSHYFRGIVMWLRPPLSLAMMSGTRSRAEIKAFSSCRREVGTELVYRLLPWVRKAQ